MLCITSDWRVKNYTTCRIAWKTLQPRYFGTSVPGRAIHLKIYGRTLEAVYGSVGQAEVYRSQFKIRRRKKGESLTDLTQDVRKLMVLAYPGPQDRTTEILVRDSFLEPLENLELVVQVQAQNLHDFASALRIAQLTEAVF